MPIVWTNGRRQAVHKCGPWIAKAMHTLGLPSDFQRFAFNIKDWIDDEDEHPIPAYISTYMILRDNLYKLLDQYAQTLRGMTREQRDLIQVMHELQESIDACE